MRITSNYLVKTTEQLVTANSHNIKIDGVVFLNMTMGDATTNQLVYRTPQVACLFLSQDV